MATLKHFLILLVSLDSRCLVPSILNPLSSFLHSFKGVRGIRCVRGVLASKNWQHKNKKEKHYEFTALIPGRECCYCSVVKCVSRKRTVHGGCSRVVQKNPENPDHHFFRTAAWYCMTDMLNAVWFFHFFLLLLFCGKWKHRQDINQKFQFASTHESKPSSWIRIVHVGAESWLRADFWEGSVALEILAHGPAGFAVGDIAVSKKPGPGPQIQGKHRKA